MTAEELRKIALECQQAGLSHEETLRYAQTGMNAGISAKQWIDVQDDPRSVEEYQQIMNGGQASKIGTVDLFAKE